MNVSPETVVEILPHLVAKTIIELKNELDTKSRESYFLKRSTVATVSQLIDVITKNVSIYRANSDVLVKAFSHEVSKNSFLKSTQNVIECIGKNKEEESDAEDDQRIVAMFDLLKTYTDYVIEVFIDQNENVSRDRKGEIYHAYNHLFMMLIDVLFKSGKAGLNPKASFMLAKIDKIKNSFSFDEVHEDDYLKIESMFKTIDPFISNWILLEDVLRAFGNRKKRGVQRFFYDAEILVKNITSLLSH